MTTAIIITILVWSTVLAVQQYIIEKLRNKYTQLSQYSEIEQSQSFMRNSHLIEIAELREYYMKQEIRSLKLQLSEEKNRNKTKRS